MNRILIILTIPAILGLAFLDFPNGALSVLVILLISVPAIAIIRHYSDGNLFLVNIFLIGLLMRIGLGVVINYFGLELSFGPDAIGYNSISARLAEIWMGQSVPEDLLTYQAMNLGSSGWGMHYLVAFLYMVFGQSALLAQSFCGVFGALTAPLAYFCADTIFNNKRVSKFTGLFVAIFPSLVIWSSQLLKDGLLIFLLLMAMLMIMQLQKKFNYLAVFVLVFSLGGILALRFYLFYIVMLSVAGSLVIGEHTSPRTIFRNVSIIIILALALTYLGVIKTASTEFETYGNLERIQISRQDLSQSAESGFGEDLDVSTPLGLLAALPIGLAYLYFAPFPWEVTKMTQVVILPETFLWWAMMPIMISGLAYTIRNKLRSAIPILIFTATLTLSYSIFQGNVGMLYRQRTQIQAFLFIFIAVGWTLIQERRENNMAVFQAKEDKFNKQLRARHIVS